MVDYPKKRAPWWSTSGTTLAADGTPLAFAAGGPADATAIVCCNGVGVSTFFWDYVGEFFSKTHRVVVWDYRGHGASGIPDRIESITMAGVADDLARVMDANQIERAVLLGHSMGCQVIFEFYRLFPDRALALVPMLGAFGHPADTFIDPRIGRTVYRAAYAVASRIPDLISMGMRMTLRKPVMWQFARWSGLVHPDLCRKSDLDPYLEHLARQDVRVFFEMVRAAQEHDASEILGNIRCPALVVAGERDLFTPRHLSVEMAGRMPNAELLEIPRGSHAALIEQPELINLRLEKFLSGPVAAYAQASQGGKAAPPAASPAA
ncbi:MAG: alpha/beta hydrolase [Deltaproteobacteria bacterium]